MTSAELRDALNHEPFRPFRLRFGSGKTIEIGNPGLVAVSSTGRTAVAFKPAGEGWDVFDILLVEAMEFDAQDSRKKRNGKH
jgi:hypothetical protein